ncbi:H-type lectin domain-containing protein [Komagataeibacter diospyri]|uniref:H-type lectin domain-containing protein n=1 Tax=Komagataeibacter diospyri TaxID=1932662 RepID=UPI003757F72A
MDRQIVYPAQIPLDSDQLNAQRNAYVGLGQLAAMAYGWATVAASGFACTPGNGLALVIGPGSLLAPGVVDASTYGTLAAVASALVRQYVSRDPVTLAVPGAGATYTVYATPATVDTDDTVLPFYNAADPSVTYAGADNSGKTAPTVRQDVVQIGIGTSVPTGAYPLWTVTVAAGATAITADMIAQAAGAPFYATIPELASTAYVDAGLATAASNLSAEAAIRAAADATLTTNVNARVSGVYGVGTGMYDGKALIQGAAGPSFCYNNGSSDVWLGLLYGVQSSISGGTKTTINGQKMLIYYINNVEGTNFQITFPESFSAVPSVFVTATSEFTTNLSAWINIVAGTVTETGFEVNVNANEPGEASTHGAGVWVFAFGAA